MNVYFDLNVFDKIEKINSLNEDESIIYSELENLVLSDKITVPYSNAHLNDLFRGFQKNPNYIDGHLDNIKRLTKNLCICQYWGQNKTTWHFREIKDFFNEKQSEWEFEPQSFEELFEEGPNPLLLLKLKPLPKNWKLGYQQDPMFGIMYPMSKIENNMYGLTADIFNFRTRLASDYGLYKTFKVYLIKGLNKISSNKEMLKAVRGNLKDLPKHLDIFEMAEKYAPKSKTSGNENYSRVIETFYKYDLKGYKTDANFNNMFDDSLHTFYGAHCDFFVTNDDRCQYKAEKTYERLKINTKVIKAKDYLQIKNRVQQNL